MKHLKKGRKFGRTCDPRNAMLRNLATSVVLYEKVETTEAKAKEIKPIVEKLVTLSRKQTLHSRRQLIKFLYDENAVKKMLEVIGPRYKTREGGYMRIVKTSRRVGDAAHKAILEFV